MTHGDDLHRLTGKRSHKLIELDDFCFAYESTPTLRHIDLCICDGDSVVLMGDNGSGKSTLLKALCGLLFAQQGSYRFDGAEVSERTMRDATFAKRLHQRVGFVFQDSDAQLFCASVEDEIAFGPLQMGLSDDRVIRRVDDVCSLLDIQDLRSRAPWTLSGGEKKRVAIACVLSMNPDVLCFDEPLAGLDARSRSWLLGFLGQLGDAGKTLVIATHDQSLADEVADYFVYMGDFHGYEDRPHVHVNL
ncbi:MAG: ABC transporter ATP-binding protein [Atopobiaceae bacterium]|nr:ABC transporter ATP-binding protein [Atopobiaceae bacterium]